MNRLPTFIISFILLCAFGCGRTNKQAETNSAETNILEKPYSPFATTNEDSLFQTIDSVVGAYINSTTHNYYPFSTKGYCLWDSVTNALYSPYNFQHTSDLDWERNCNGVVEYLNWHLWNIVEPLVMDKRLVALMMMEQSLTDSLLRAQFDWIRAHFHCSQEGSYGTDALELSNLYNEMLTILNLNLRDILDAITNPDYRVGEMRHITKRHLQIEYQHILSDKIPYYKDDTIYDEALDRACFYKEIQAWDRLIANRQKILVASKYHLANAVKMGTYRLMFNRLRQLKNEFEPLGIYGNEMAECLLSDTCTYEELMAYPNFTTKWNEHLKEIE